MTDKEIDAALALPRRQVSGPDELLAEINVMMRRLDCVTQGEVDDLLRDCQTCLIAQRLAANVALAARCVPREPTEAMIAAAFEHWSGRCSGGIAVMWQAMYDAALASQAEGERK